VSDTSRVDDSLIYVKGSKKSAKLSPYLVHRIESS